MKGLLFGLLLASAGLCGAETFPGIHKSLKRAQAEAEKDSDQALDTNNALLRAAAEQGFKVTVIKDAGKNIIVIKRGKHKHREKITSKTDGFLAVCRAMTEILKKVEAVKS